MSSARLHATDAQALQANTQLPTGSLWDSLPRQFPAALIRAALIEGPPAVCCFPASLHEAFPVAVPGGCPVFSADGMIAMHRCRSPGRPHHSHPSAVEHLSGMLRERQKALQSHVERQGWCLGVSNAPVQAGPTTATPARWSTCPACCASARRRCWAAWSSASCWGGGPLGRSTKVCNVPLWLWLRPPHAPFHPVLACLIRPAAPSRPSSTPHPPWGPLMSS